MGAGGKGVQVIWTVTAGSLAKESEHESIMALAGLLKEVNAQHVVQ